MANIRDIAKHAGVSVATVSRALANPAIVKAETIARVTKAIEEMQYRPHAVASSLRRQRNKNILVAVPFFDNPFYSEIIRGIENIAHEQGYKILLGETRDEQERLDRYAEMLLSKGADGLILLGSLLPTVVEEARRLGAPVPVPLVLACERYDGLDCSTVEIDNHAAALLATEHLIEQGHRRIATITGTLGNSISRDRLAGFESAIRAAGLRLTKALVEQGEFTIKSGHLAMTRLLALKKRPTAVFCASDEMAFGAINAIAGAGLRVPDDIAIIGFDDIRFAPYTLPPLTTITQPSQRIGETAMQLMLKTLMEPAAAPSHLVLPHTLMLRESTAPLTPTSSL